MSAEPIVVKKVADLQKWRQNPRYIKRERYDNLKAQIKLYGFKDVLKLAADGKTIINGNHRLDILRELKIEEVNCIIYDVSSEADILKIALAAPDYAEYDKEALTELIYKSDIPVEDLQPFEVDLGKRTPILELINDVGPSLFEDEEKPKEHKPREVTCPDCGSIFEV